VLPIGKCFVHRQQDWLRHGLQPEVLSDRNRLGYFNGGRGGKLIAFTRYGYDVTRGAAVVQGLAEQRTILTQIAFLRRKHPPRHRAAVRPL
jgi:hypothetical protein